MGLGKKIKKAAKKVTHSVKKVVDKVENKAGSQVKKVGNVVANTVKDPGGAIKGVEKQVRRAKDHFEEDVAESKFGKMTGLNTVTKQALAIPEMIAGSANAIGRIARGGDVGHNLHEAFNKAVDVETDVLKSPLETVKEYTKSAGIKEHVTDRALQRYDNFSENMKDFNVMGEIGGEVMALRKGGPLNYLTSTQELETAHRRSKTKTAKAVGALTTLVASYAAAGGFAGGSAGATGTTGSTSASATGAGATASGTTSAGVVGASTAGTSTTAAGATAATTGTTAGALKSIAETALLGGSAYMGVKSYMDMQKAKTDAKKENNEADEKEAEAIEQANADYKNSVMASYADYVSKQQNGRYNFTTNSGGFGNYDEDNMLGWNKKTGVLNNKKRYI